MLPKPGFSVLQLQMLTYVPSEPLRPLSSDLLAAKSKSWPARYSTWLFIQLKPKGKVFSFMVSYHSLSSFVYRLAWQQQERSLAAMQT